MVRASPDAVGLKKLASETGDPEPLKIGAPKTTMKDSRRELPDFHPTLSMAAPGHGRDSPPSFLLTTFGTISALEQKCKP